MIRKKLLTAGIVLHTVCLFAAVAIFLCATTVASDSNPILYALAGIPIFGSPFLCSVVYLAFCLIARRRLVLIRNNLSCVMLSEYGCMEEGVLYLASIGDALALFPLLIALGDPQPLPIAVGALLLALVLANAIVRFICAARIKATRKQREAAGIFPKTVTRAGARFPTIVHKRLLLAIVITGILCLALAFTVYTLYYRFSIRAQIDDAIASMSEQEDGTGMMIGIAAFVVLAIVLANMQYLMIANVGFVCIIVMCIYAVCFLAGKKFRHIKTPWLTLLLAEAACGIVASILYFRMEHNPAVTAVAIAAVAVWALHFLPALAYTVILLRMKSPAQKAAPDGVPSEKPLPEIAEHNGAAETAVSAAPPEDDGKGENA